MMKLTENEQFFYDHAGYGFNPSNGETAEDGKIRGARALALAEATAEAKGITFRWEDDWEIGSHKEFFGPDSAYDDHEPDTCEQCDAIDASGEVLASLGCVDDAGKDYRRVVEAELAAEVLA
jgi:hypothetical protein